MARMDLNSQRNEDCQKKCNKEARKERTENDLCKGTKSKIDRLPVRCVGDWAEKKIYLLYQYFGIFANGMKNKWPGKLNYIEICSGPGRCINRDAGLEMDGTALAIIKHGAYKHINKALFFDLNETVVSVLNQRIQNAGVNNAAAYVADYNKADELCAIITKEINKDSLNLVFIDPTDCSVPFTLIETIKRTLPNVDFMINVATGTDFNRNVPMAFESEERASKYCQFLGSTVFFTNQENINLAEKKDYIKLRSNFRDEYKKSLARIGYSFFDIELIEHYYDILFAASHQTAMDFWNKATKVKHDGQRELAF